MHNIADCRDRELHAEDLVLLTKKAPPSCSRSLKAPPLHVIGLIERSERDAGRTRLRVAVNILSGDEGTRFPSASLLSTDFLSWPVQPQWQVFADPSRCWDITLPRPFGAPESAALRGQQLRVRRSRCCNAATHMRGSMQPRSPAHILTAPYNCACRQGRHAAGGADEAAGTSHHLARHQAHVLDAAFPPVQGALP